MINSEHLAGYLKSLNVNFYLFFSFDCLHVSNFRGILEIHMKEVINEMTKLISIFKDVGMSTE